MARNGNEPALRARRNQSDRTLSPQRRYDSGAAEDNPPAHTTATLSLGGVGTQYEESTLVNSGVPIVHLGLVD
jgi:hypothetical protein